MSLGISMYLYLYLYLYLHMNILIHTSYSKYRYYSSEFGRSGRSLQAHGNIFAMQFTALSLLKCYRAESVPLYNSNKDVPSVSQFDFNKVEVQSYCIVSLKIPLLKICKLYKTLNWVAQK